MDLSPRKFRLAIALFANFGSLASASDLALIAWGEERERAEPMMNAHVELLRHLLTLDGTFGFELQRTPGHAYRIRESVRR